jgi:transcriptional regulator with XRE-family HTH domain
MFGKFPGRSSHVPEPQLIDWINDQLGRTNLSQSEASRRAGLGPNAISEIINGRTPGLKVCIALGEFFGVSVEYVLRLAGHLPPRQAVPSELRRKVDRIAELLTTLPPDLQDRLADALIIQAEASKAAFVAAERQANQVEE